MVPSSLPESSSIVVVEVACRVSIELGKIVSIWCAFRFGMEVILLETAEW